MSDTTIHTVEKIDPNELSVMQREMNRGLMVAFINHDLINRANLDVRYSAVFYDEDKDFLYAWDEVPTEDQLKQLRANTSIRFWSIGV